MVPNIFLDTMNRMFWLHWFIAHTFANSDPEAEEKAGQPAAHGYACLVGSSSRRIVSNATLPSIHAPVLSNLVQVEVLRAN
jgi:hypothetical protein